MKDEERQLAKKIIDMSIGLNPAMKKRLDSNRHIVYLHRMLDPKKAAVVRLAIDSIAEEKRPRHLTFIDEDKRYYPAGNLASTLLGITNSELQGTMGLEKIFNDDLQGSSLTVKGLRDPAGNVALEALDLSLDIPAGDHLVLTIDKPIQFIAERVIEETVRQHKAKTGIAIAMKPDTGEILAMAQYPRFNPNRLTKKTPAFHQRNYSVEWVFEPGSTLKTFVVAAALESAKFLPDDKIYCNMGYYQLGKRTIHDSKPYGHLSVSEILSKSSNIGISKIALELGAQTVYSSLVNFGFNQQTGIRLPSESRGILNPPGKWQPIELANAAFGQGMNVTGIQLVTAMAAVANGGLLVKPRLVDRVISADGTVKKIFESEVLHRAIRPETARILKGMLVDATSENGTGLKAQIDGCTVAGKTGTAEKLYENAKHDVREYWTSSFVGFLPAEDPKLVIMVMVDEPRGKAYYGGDVAAPAFRRIAMEIGAVQGICTRKSDTLAGVK